MSIFNCNITFKKVEGDSYTSTFNKLEAHSFIDSEANILDLPSVRTAVKEIHQEAKDLLGIDVTIFKENDKKLLFNKEQFKAIDEFNKIEKSNLTPEQTQQIKELKQSDLKWNKYSDEDIQRFIDSVFPESQVKEIVYHGTPYKFDKFENQYIGSNEGVTMNDSLGEGFFFSTNSDIIKVYKKDASKLFNNQENSNKFNRELSKSGGGKSVLINAITKGYKDKYGTEKVNGKDANYSSTYVGESFDDEGSLVKDKSKLEQWFSVYDAKDIYILNSDKAISDMEKFVQKDVNKQELINQLPDCI